MSGISAKAPGKLENRIKYNGNELQSNEFSNGSGLELYDFNARTYDPQMGRFIQVDPMTDEGGQEMISPYHYAYNNPVTFGDPDGKIPIAPAIPIIIDALVEAGLITAGHVGALRALHKHSEHLAPRPQQIYADAVYDVMKARAESKAQAQAQADAAPDVPLDQQPIYNLVKDGGVSTAENKTSTGKYSHLKEPNKVGPGKETTAAQRKRILEENKKQNGGKLKSDGDGRELNPPKKSQKGQPADMNQAEVDHITPKSQGGSNSNANTQVLSKEENLKKGNRNE